VQRRGARSWRPCSSIRLTRDAAAAAAAAETTQAMKALALFRMNEQDRSIALCMEIEV
jgi:hypothetical protein